jgi:hypothetical protein
MTLAAIQTRPLPATGHHIGRDNWRLCVDGLSLGGVWTALTDDVRGMEWTAGNNDPRGRPETGQLRMTLANRAGTWSPARLLSDDTPARIGALIRVAAVNDDLDDWITTSTIAHDAGLNITADMQIVVRYQAVDWTNSFLVASKGSGFVGWTFGINGTGGLTFMIDTFSGTVNVASTVGTGFVDGTDHWLGVTYDADNGAGNYAVRFWTSSDGIAWTQLGTTVTAAIVGTYEPTTHAVSFGTTAALGKLRHFELRSGIGAAGVISTSAPIVASTPALSGLAAYPSWQVDEPLTSPEGWQIAAGYQFVVGTSWLPLWTGRVTSWVDEEFGLGADRQASVVAEQTVAWLARVNRNAVGSVGAGETPSARFTRLKDDALFPWSFYADYTVQPVPAVLATTMANNRLSEMHLTADSADLYFRSHRSGYGVAHEVDARHSVVTAQPGTEPSKSIQGRASRDMFPNGLVFHPSGTSVAPSPYIILGGGRYLTTPDAAAISVTGDLAVWAELALDDWITGSVQVVACQRASSSSNFGWCLSIGTTGLLTFSWTTDGTTLLSSTSTTPITFADRQRGVIGATIDVNNGAAGRTVRFWQADASVVWAAHAAFNPTTDFRTDRDQLGADVVTAGTTSIFNSTAALTIGRDGDGTAPIVGKFWRFRLDNAIGTGGIPVATGATFRIEPVHFPTAAATSTFTTDEYEGANVTVTINGSSFRNTPAVAVYNGDSHREANDDQAHLTRVEFARVGGTVQTDAVTEDPEIGPGELKRSDLLCNTDALTLALAARVRRRRYGLIRRVEGVSVSSLTEEANIDALLATDIGDLVEICPPDGGAVAVAGVSAMRHQILGMTKRRILWRAEYGFSAFPGP